MQSLLDRFAFQNYKFLMCTELDKNYFYLAELCRMFHTKTRLFVSLLSYLFLYSVILYYNTIIVHHIEHLLR